MEPEKKTNQRGGHQKLKINEPHDKETKTEEMIRKNT